MNYVRRPCSTALIISLLVLVGACIAGAGLLFSLAVFGSTSGPSLTVERYYDEIRAGDYAAAHAQFSGGLAADLTQDDLREMFTTAEAGDGPITDVTISNTRIDGDRATVVATVERERTSSQISAFLIQRDDRWLIDDFVTP